MNTYDLNGDFGIGYTYKGEEFYFDLEDYDKIKDYHWFIDPQGYVRTSNPSRRMHRIILGLNDSNIMVDHIHHKKFDNRKSELRIATNSQNQMNRDIPSQNKSGFRGVSWHKNKNAWIVQIGINGKLKYIGIFKDIEDAISARLDAEKYYFGEYNFQR
jgi:hypothetical protein